MLELGLKNNCSMRFLELGNIEGYLAQSQIESRCWSRWGASWGLNLRKRTASDSVLLEESQYGPACFSPLVLVEPKKTRQ